MDQGADQSLADEACQLSYVERGEAVARSDTRWMGALGVFLPLASLLILLAASDKQSAIIPLIALCFFAGAGASALAAKSRRVIDRGITARRQVVRRLAQDGDSWQLVDPQPFDYEEVKRRIKRLKRLRNEWLAEEERALDQERRGSIEHLAADKDLSWENRVASLWREVPIEKRQRLFQALAYIPGTIDVERIFGQDPDADFGGGQQAWLAAEMTASGTWWELEPVVRDALFRVLSERGEPLGLDDLCQGEDGRPELDWGQFY